MKKIHFWKYSPCGNMTILLETTCDEKERLAICSEVIRTNHLAAEQAGIIDFSTIPPQLTMMGGEFCLNATRSFATLLAQKNLLKKSDKNTFHGILKSSGNHSPVQVIVQCLNESEAISSVSIDIQNVSSTHYSDGIDIIRLDGITHVLLDSKLYPLPPKENWDDDATTWRTRLNLCNEPAVGIIRVKADKSKNRFDIMPYVWVRDTQFSCMETSCGSGSLAVAIWNQQSQCSICQPSGESLDITLDENRHSAWVSGSVRLIAQGETFISGI